MRYMAIQWQSSEKAFIFEKYKNKETECNLLK